MKHARIAIGISIVLFVMAAIFAFKVKNRFSNTYCIATTIDPPGSGWCTGQIANSKFAMSGDPNPVTYYYTTKPISPACNQVYCSLSTSFVPD